MITGMEQIKKEYIFWLFLAAGFIAALATLTFYTLKIFEKNKLPIENSNKKEPPKNEAGRQIKSSGNQTTIQESDPKNHLIFYRSGVFTPSKVRVENIDGKGSCFITIFNDSVENLKIGLSPHKKEGDQGPDYNFISPKSSLILDPRFRIPKVAFHNHNLPSAEFKITLGKGCMLD